MDVLPATGNDGTLRVDTLVGSPAQEHTQEKTVEPIRMTSNDSLGTLYAYKTSFTCELFFTLSSKPQVFLGRVLDLRLTQTTHLK